MENRTAVRRRRAPWSFVFVGVVVATVIVIGVGPPGVLLSHATVCRTAEKIGTYTVWTPLQLINIPDGGNISFATNEWNITVSSGSLIMNELKPFGGPIQSGMSGGSGLNRAGIWVEYGDFNWTFYRTVNESVIGGAQGPCTQPYVAELTVPGGACGGWAVVPIADNTTDAVQPHVWNGTAGFNGTETYPGCPVQTPGTYAWFDSEFHSTGAGISPPVVMDLCGVPGYRPLVLEGVAQVPLVLFVPANGTHISVAATLKWNDSPALKVYMGPTVSYLVQGGWSWTLSSVGPATSAIDPNVPLLGLVAFERTAC